MRVSLFSRLSAGIFLFFSISSASAQTFTEINYTGSSIPIFTTQGENVLAGNPVVDGYTNQALSFFWDPEFDGTNLELISSMLENAATGKTELSCTAIGMNYVFQPGYTYYVTVTYFGNVLGTNPGFGMSVGTPQLTNVFAQTGSAMTGRYGTAPSNITLDDNFLANTTSSTFVTITSTSAYSTYTFPSFSVGSSTTGLNLEVLPCDGNVTTGMEIANIAVVGVPAISGASLVCTSQAFSIANSAGWPVTWSLAPAIASVSSSGNTATVTMTAASGSTTLSAVYTAPNGLLYGTNFPLYIGTPLPPGDISTNATVFTRGGTYVFNSAGANLWTTNGSIITGQGTSIARLRAPNSGSILDIWTYTTNACGSSPQTFASYSLTPTMSVTPFVDSATSVDAAKAAIATSSPKPWSATSPMLYPNPATNNFEVFIPRTDFTNTYVKIYDIGGRVVKTIIPTGQTLLIDASRWAKGTYMVSIFDGQKLTTQKLVKQ